MMINKHRCKCFFVWLIFDAIICFIAQIFSFTIQNCGILFLVYMDKIIWNRPINQFSFSSFWLGYSRINKFETEKEIITLLYYTVAAEKLYKFSRPINLDISMMEKNRRDIIIHFESVQMSKKKEYLQANGKIHGSQYRISRCVVYTNTSDMIY